MNFGSDGCFFKPPRRARSRVLARDLCKSRIIFFGSFPTSGVSCEGIPRVPSRKTISSQPDGGWLSNFVFHDPGTRNWSRSLTVPTISDRWGSRGRLLAKLDVGSDIRDGTRKRGGGGRKVKGKKMLIDSNHRTAKLFISLRPYRVESRNIT